MDFDFPLKSDLTMHADNPTKKKRLNLELLS